MTDPNTAPPSYEATLTNSIGSSAFHDPLSQSQLLHAQLTTSRTQHLHTIAAVHILPAIQRRAERGLNCTSIALLPANIASATPSSSIGEDASPPKVINIVSADSNDEDLQLVQLTDPTDSVYFWSQLGIQHELRRALVQILESSAELGREKGKPQMIPSHDKSIEAPIPLLPQSQSKFSRFLGRRSSSKGQGKGDMLPVVADNTRSAETSMPTKQIAVSVQMDEFCMRTQTYFGLYETVTRSAIVIGVQIRSG